MDSARPVILAARAKINLSLDVRRRRPDGYHELDTVFQSLALHDTVMLRRVASGVEIACDQAGLPLGPKNLAYRAAEAVRRAYGVDYGVRIDLKKRIPVAAGLGGGSADAAAVLRGLPALWGLPALPPDRLQALACDLGADVPFCLLGGTARGRGIGELLEPLPGLSGCDVLLVKPRAWLSTARVYERLDLGRAVHPEMDAVVEAIRRRDLLALGGAWAISIYWLIGRRLRQRLDLIPYTWSVYGIAGLFLLGGAGFLRADLLPRTPVDLLAFLLLALIPTLAGHSICNWALKELPASTVSTYILGEPIGSTILAAFLLHERPGWRSILGGMMVLAGLAWFFRWEAGSARRSPAPSSPERP
ncbi:MAG: 4-(cytidine 5'-diphospho)-2-C-methyl-D-erythritol kinase [Firmicutes bacterium]|nr:4-(cytidine 5'-diphospho)-2-C-methyl-D-erythritol kinase [Bacillota bacterium]